MMTTITREPADLADLRERLRLARARLIELDDTQFDEDEWYSALVEVQRREAEFSVRYVRAAVGCGVSLN